jgi:hypothetical protein
MSVTAAAAAPIHRPRHPTPADVLRDLARWLAAHSSGARLLAETRALQARSDAELARNGLRRERIVPRVFSAAYGR